MKNRLEELGCFVWMIGVLVVSAGAGLLFNHVLAKAQLVPVWENILLSIFVRIVILIILGAISFLTLIANSKEYDEECPDFSSQV